MATNTPIPKKILVFGATGVIGKFILQELYNARTSFEKIGVFTSENTAKNKASEVASWKEKSINVIVGDITSETDVAKAYEDYDTVISALGRTAIQLQTLLIQIAETSTTITTFYPSEYGTDIEYSASSASEKPHQQKLKVRAYIRSNTSKLYITYLVTGPYSDLYFGANPVRQGGGFYVKERKAVLLGDGNGKVSFTTMRDVGRLLVAALHTPAAQKERILKVNSFTVTPREILREFERQTGVQWAVEYVGVEELKSSEKEAWEKESPAATLFTLRRIWTEGGTLYEERDNAKVGFGDKDAETVEEQVGKAIEKAG